MPGSITLSVDGGADEAADLSSWLGGEDELRGHVRSLPGAVPEGALGADLAQLLITLETSGGATALASVVVAWLRRRPGSLWVRVSRPDGARIELRADRVRALDAAAVQEQVAQLAALAWPEVAERATDHPADGEAPDP